MNMMKNNYTPRSGYNKRILPFLWRLLAIVALTQASFVSAAQAVATVSKNIVAVNEVFQLTISIDDNVNTSALDLSPLEEHFSYGRPSVSSGTTMINGAVTRSTEWRVALAAKEIGEFTIPSFRIGATTTEPITITSLKSSNANSQSTAQPDITVDHDIDKNQLYVGESIRYTVRIRIGEQMSKATLIAPSGDGLDVKQIGDDRQAEPVLNGRRYLVITRDYQITASKPGTILLRGAEFRGNVVKSGRGFGSTLRIPVEKQTDNLELTIKDKPASYQGLWLPTQDLQLEQQWQPDNLEIRVGDPLTRTITLRIKNAEQSSMPNLALQYPDKVKVYNEKPVYSTVNGYTVMTLKQVILPRERGELELPPLSINWWNTETSQQETSQVDGLAITVLPGDNINNSLNLPLRSEPSSATPIAKETGAGNIQVVNDSGYWPWLTALFAGLWLITTILWLKARAASRQIVAAAAMKQPVMNVAPLAGMKQAVKDNSPIKVQAYYRQWSQNNPDNPQQEQLRQAVHAMMTAHFSKQPEKWDSAKLLQLIQSIGQSEKTTTKNSTTTSALAPLVPEK
ncbi:aerotolerance protein BatD [Photobacterium proteolyticum]|uniref:Aerotolerance protein BatD n=1 Tax=Photobacterium proteolyticum TaxID=1903952 RepID=A0A1Q9GCL0_9GAMM|nr:BatD family protein [Photobacterium proteolyticum]OLQ72114.1 aerotolerance protein BatD [Photobacterium proteolyticum]